LSIINCISLTLYFLCSFCSRAVSNQVSLFAFLSCIVFRASWRRLFELHSTSVWVSICWRVLEIICFMIHFHKQQYNYFPFHFVRYARLSIHSAGYIEYYIGSVRILPFVWHYLKFRYILPCPESKDTSRVSRKGNFLCLVWQHCRRPWSFTCEPCSFGVRI
jgi:hypothetical protein